MSHGVEYLLSWASSSPAVKMVVPLHGWLPDAHSCADRRFRRLPVSAENRRYGLLRSPSPLFPNVGVSLRLSLCGLALSAFSTARGWLPTQYDIVARLLIPFPHGLCDRYSPPAANWLTRAVIQMIA